MPTFTQIQSDSFQRSNTTASANPGSVGNSWIDEAGSTFSVYSQQLEGSSANQSGYATQILARPSSEQYQDQKIVVTYPGSGQNTASGSTVIGAVCRYVATSGNHYEAVAVPSTTTAYIYKVVGGTRTQLTSISCSGWDPTHAYTVELDCTGLSPATLTFTLVDTTSNVTRGSGSVSDSESTLQTQSGVSGVSCWSFGGGSNTTALVSNVTTYYSPVAATSLKVTGPSSGNTGAASTAFTVAAQGTLSSNVTVSLSDGSNGGTFSPTSLTLTSSATSATFTYTPASSGTKTLTASASGLTSATASYSVTTPAPATALTLTGPGTGVVNSPSSSFTVTANGAISGTVTVTLTTSGSGSFSPSTVSLTSSATSASFSYTSTTAQTATLTAAASGLTSATASYASSAKAAIPTAPIVNYGSGPFTTGSTPSTFVPNFGAGDEVAARTIDQVNKGFLAWLDNNGFTGRGIVTEAGIPGSSQYLTEPGPTIAYQGTAYAAGWTACFQQWYELMNRKSVHVTAWNACQWRVPLEGYTTDDGTSKVINVQQTSTATVENNISNTIYQRGVAFAGADFSDQGPNGALNRSTVVQPGAGYYYALPGNFPILAAKGVTLIRYPIRWERVQPNLKQALDPNEMALLLTSIQGANAAGCKVLLDIHNYARYDTTPTGANANGVYSLGQNAPASVGGTMTDCLVDLWQRLATYFKANAPIWGYDIMNEPHDLPNGVSDWQTASQRVVEAIRVIDQNAYIAVEGYSYANAANWISNNGSNGWLTETIPSGQTGAGSARNADPLILWNAHNYFDTIPNGNDGSYNANGGSYAQELAAAQSSGYKPWSTSGYTAPATGITSQTGVRPTYKGDFSVNPGAYSTSNLNGYVAGSNTVTIPYTTVGDPVYSMKVVCSTTSDEGALRASLTGGNVSRIDQFDFQVDSASSSALATTSEFNIKHYWRDNNSTDFVEIRINGSGSGYTTEIAIPGTGGATARGTTVLPAGSFATFKLVVTDTNFQLFLNGSSTAEVTLAGSNSGINIGGWSMGKFYGTSPLTMYFGNATSGNTATYDARANGGLISSTYTAATVAPKVTLASNVTSGTAPQSLTLSAVGTPGSYPLSSVKFYQGGTLIGTTTATPYTLAVSNLSAGTYGYTAVIADTSGTTANSNVVTVTVAAASTGTTTNPTQSVPSVSLALSASSGVAPSSVVLTATPTTTSGYVSLVEFFNSGAKIGQATASPWSFTDSNLAVGTYQFTAKVTDSNGNYATSTSQPYVVSATATVTASPPTIGISISVTNSTAPASVTLNAVAAAVTAGATVASVAFYQNSVLLYTDMASPYSYSVTGLAAGTYAFNAIVTDSNGSQTTSASQTLVIAPVTVITTGTTATAAPTQIATADTQGTLLDIKRYVAAQPGRNDATVPQATRDQLINDAREAYYSSRPWSFLKRQGFVLSLAADTQYTTLLAAPLPADRNRAAGLNAVYDSLGRPVNKMPIDQLLMATTVLYDCFYAIDEYRGLLLTNVPQATLSIDYLIRVAPAALDGSQDSLPEAAANLTSIKYLAMALTWVGNERDQDSLEYWMTMYEKQYALDVRQDIQNEPIRRYRQTPRGTGFTKRGYPYPPTGYISGRY